MFSFFSNDPATTEIYTLSLHDALPISRSGPSTPRRARTPPRRAARCRCRRRRGDRKSTRLNSSHTVISYAVFCLKKKTGATPTAHTDRRTQEVHEERFATVLHSFMLII